MSGGPLGARGPRCQGSVACVAAESCCGPEHCHDQGRHCRLGSSVFGGIISSTAAIAAKTVASRCAANGLRLDDPGNVCSVLADRPASIDLGQNKKGPRGTSCAQADRDVLPPQG